MSLRNLASGVIALLFCLCAGTTTHAQTFEVNRFRPAPLASDGFASDGTDTPGHLGMSAVLTLDYATGPLVVRLATQDEYSVISHQLALQGAFALGLSDRLALFLGVPMNLVMDGDDPPAGILTRLPRPEGAGLGDATLGARLRLVGDLDSAFALALQATMFFPLARAANDDQRYSGNRAPGVEPQLTAQLHFGGFRVRGSLGVRIRDRQEFSNLTIDDELTYTLGLDYGFVEDRLHVIADLFGASFLRELAREVASPLELLLGLRYLDDSGFLIGAGAGPGLNHGVGTPSVRVLFTLGYATPRNRDRDRDGIPDAADSCIDQAEDRDGFQDEDGCPELDNDADGVADANDRCPREAEDRDGFQDDDGCPDPDNDGDGVADAADRCPNEAEDRDGVEDDDGCPEHDRDRDGVKDDVDACPDQAEDADRYEDEDGCPDPDNDGDGIEDAADRCPNERGVPEQQGCPKTRLEAGRITIIDRVEFASGSDQLLPQSDALLTEVRDVLEKNPQVKRLRIEGHTDSSGSNALNLKLSKGRAASVRAFLVKNGIATDRLEAWGCGESAPLAEGKDAASLQTNRRVEFHVLDPAPETGPRTLATCEPQP